MKSINWYATARSGSLRSNIYQRKDAANCLVALDMTMAGQSAYRGKSERVEDPILEEAVSLAAGIALFHLEQGIRTALFTNAPTLQWVRREGAGTNTPDLWLKRVRQITALDFATGDEQAEKILKFCAAIDENGRAYPEAQHELWSKIMEVPAHTIIYLLTLQSPPTAWNKIAKNGAPSSNPSLFYSAERLSGLATSIVKVINLSEVIK